MTMPRGVTEIDRLIEQGLTLYGEGDLDGALLLWERVLLIDPENPQANSYVEYVRLNYDLLTTDGNTEDSGPFGIGDGEPEYQIEILPGEDIAPAAAAPLYMDARDEGWVIGDEAGGEDTGDGLMVELEADEPPPPPDPPSFENDKTGESVSFDDNTREYPGGAGRPTSALLGHGTAPLASTDFEPSETPAFGNAHDFQTPTAFASQPTDVRRRELGFVQPTEHDGRGALGPPELQIKLRTPPSQSIPVARGTPELHRALADVHRATTATHEAQEPDDGDESLEATLGGTRELTLDFDAPSEESPAPAYESLDLDLSASSDPQVTLDLVGRAETRPAVAPGGEPEDLIASLPTPRPPSSPTKPLPGNTRAPATEAPPLGEAARLPPMPGASPASPSAPPDAAKAQTQELPFTLQLDPLLAVHPDPHHTGAMTRDFAENPTSQVKRPGPGADPMISAPTRELGLRELTAKPPRARPSTEDETTGQADIHRLRAARASAKPEIPPGMDPIDARSAEILEDVDRATPGSPAPSGSGAFRAAVETREERTRRRITALLERATEWSRNNDFERAVTAVDLALSEDPNSALAQKLIHRNREVIMNAFQAFLGDLQRSPALARPLHELGSAPISPRAAFLLSRVDGTLSLDEILDVSGMPRLEAYRYLCQLFLRGILR